MERGSIRFNPGMRTISRPRIFLLLTAATVFLGVAALASTGGGPGPAQDKSFDLSALPPASEYSTEEPKGRGFLGSEAAVLGRSLARINKVLGTSLRPDNRLSRLSRWVYERFETDRSIPQGSALDLLTHHLGLPEPLPHVLMTYAPDAPRLANVVSARLAKVFNLADYTHIGGVAERVEGGVVVVIALSRRHIKMAPVPRSLKAPGRLALEGSLLDGYARPEFAHTLPSGETRLEDLGTGPAFAASVDLTMTGRHRLEIVASGRSGPEVIVNFPVYVEVAAEKTVDATPEPRRALGPSEAQSRLFELINEERSRAGLGALAIDPELGDVALRHSEDMRKNNFVAHISPTSGSAEERLLKAGIVTDVAAENVGRGYNPEEIHRGLMDSPGHRSAILHAHVTHVGIGISSERKGDRTDYLVTELFIRRIPPLGADAKSLFLPELNGLRERSGEPLLEEDTALSELAGEAVREFMEKPAFSQEDMMSRLRRRLEQGDLKFGSATVMFHVAGSLKEGAEGAAAGAKAIEKARRVGIGIAQGTRPDLVPNSIVLVLIFVE